MLNLNYFVTYPSPTPTGATTELSCEMWSPAALAPLLVNFDTIKGDIGLSDEVF